jgi:fatty-acyl-CoA synthase
MTSTAPGAVPLDREHSVTKAGSADVPHFFTETRVVRPDPTRVEPGETGKIPMSGPNVMPGYWRLPDGSAARCADGWCRGGDVRPQCLRRCRGASRNTRSPCRSS